MLRMTAVPALLIALSVPAVSAPAWADTPQATRICLANNASTPARFTIDWRPAGAAEVTQRWAGWLRDSQYTFTSGTTFCVRPPGGVALRVTAEAHTGAGWATACWQEFQAGRSAILITEGDAMEQSCAIR